MRAISFAVVVAAISVAASTAVADSKKAIPGDPGGFAEAIDRSERFLSKETLKFVVTKPWTDVGEGERKHQEATGDVFVFDPGNAKCWQWKNVSFKTDPKHSQDKAHPVTKAHPSADDADVVEVPCAPLGKKVSKEDARLAKQSPVELANDDDVDHPYKLTCGNGSTEEGTVDSHGVQVLGKDLAGCKLTVGAHSAKVKNEVTCRISGGTVSCD